MTTKGSLQVIMSNVKEVFWQKFSKSHQNRAPKWQSSGKKGSKC